MSRWTVTATLTIDAPTVEDAFDAFLRLAAAGHLEDADIDATPIDA